MKYKKCSKCGKIKLLTEFYKKKSIKGGRRSECKKCSNDQHKKYYTLYKKEIRKRGRKHATEYHRQYVKSKPWAKTLGSILSRCNTKNGRYYKKGIKNFLTLQNLKYLWFRDKGYLLKYPSIDRIDSDKHYTLDNCRYIEFEENMRRQFLKK